MRAQRIVGPPSTRNALDDPTMSSALADHWTFRPMISDSTTKR
ncbi:hypothetical protein AS9A_0407 [Hoyosella subflava DQS3-9A1]|uniref:Uncharacterized protein n=1 Tax=Hoyosella subflava (strain DSM 45089 / JCM 17490 / NBRC 109087 / DQS3-9A1) TaxID=443218 RepID=F6EHR8_HOYSD|nr:hypothetical protein AS9A_0407 [Hoyosella subflava DQS3-9A1]